MEFLKKHGEKILLLLLIVGLALTVVLGLAKVSEFENPNNLSLVSPEGNLSLEVDALDATLARLMDAPPTVDVGMGAFTPEVRVICMNQNCRALIDPDSKTCVYCGEKQTVGPRDTDKDGITDSQEAAWNMDPTDPTDVYLDPDGDGFPTLYEFQQGTDPTDATSTPDLIKFVRLKDVTETSIQFELRGTAKLGESYTLQLFWKYPGEEEGTTAYVRTGRTFGRNNELTAESFTEKRTLRGDRYIDESVAVIRSGRYELKLGRTPDKNKGSMTESVAELVTIFGPDLEMTVRVDETIVIGNKSYKVVDITKQAVVLQRDVDSDPMPDPIFIKPTTSEDKEALEKFSLDGGSGNEQMLNDGGSDGMIPQDFF